MDNFIASSSAKKKRERDTHRQRSVLIFPSSPPKRNVPCDGSELELHAERPPSFAVNISRQRTPK